MDPSITFATGQQAIVVDASVTIPFLAGDPAWGETWRMWTETNAMLLAPTHYPVEVANALLRGVRLASVEAVVRLQRLFAAGVETAERGAAGLLGAIELADRHRLSVYDASYLYLVMDVDGALATLDRALARAATSEGVEVLG